MRRSRSRSSPSRTAMSCQRTGRTREAEGLLFASESRAKRDAESAIRVETAARVVAVEPHATAQRDAGAERRGGPPHASALPAHATAQGKTRRHAVFATQRHHPTRAVPKVDRVQL